MLRLVSRSFKPAACQLSKSSARAFHTTLLRKNASYFGMPAMSPTMDEGGVVAWHVKEGDAFESGDLLLEVETDKATIAVEAQDDGIMAKILKNDGAKEVKVGAPIAIIAEPGDNLADLDLAKLEAEASSAGEAPKAEEPVQAKEELVSAASTAPVSGFTGGKPDSNQVFFPSVELLLEANGVSREDALSKITATGPKGRILKGDVLAYLGQISSDLNSSIASFIDNKSHLDLSNIELRQAAPESAAAAASEEGKPAEASAAPAAPAKPPKKQPLTLHHQFVISSVIPKKALSKLVATASNKAEQYAYSSNTYAHSDLTDPIFELLIAPQRNTERFKASYEIAESSTTTKDVDDIFDFEPYEVEEAKFGDLLTTVDLSVVVNEKVLDGKVRAEKYVKKFGYYLDKIDAKFAATKST